MNITKIPFFSSHIPAVSFKAKQNKDVNNLSEPKDSFVKSDSQEYKNMSDESKLKLLDSILKKKIHLCNDCVQYYKGENEELCDSAKREISKLYAPKHYSLDFMKEALDEIKQTKDVEEKRSIAQAALERLELIASSVLSEEDLLQANKLTLKKIDEVTKIALENQNKVYKYIEKTGELDSLPRELFHSWTTVDMIGRYTMNLKSLPNTADCVDELFDFAGEKAQELSAYRQKFFEDSHKYAAAIQNSI